MNYRFGLVVPTLNAGNMWVRWIAALRAQSVAPSVVMILDSKSEDSTVEYCDEASFTTMSIERSNFNHGGTRQLGLNCLKDHVDILVFMTQDAILSDSNSLDMLLTAFSDPAVGAAFGRQLAIDGANKIAMHARLFNYPEISRTVRPRDRESLGFKSCFLSNSFAAYRVSDLIAVGGFPENVILGEDTAVAARMLIAGKSIRYQAEACVFHSHNYTHLEEFRRYFDTGVFHARERWLLKEFGGADGEGFRFVKSETCYLSKNAPWLIPSALFRTICKLGGYRLGRAEASLPVRLKRRLSMFRGFWG